MMECSKLSKQQRQLLRRKERAAKARDEAAKAELCKRSVLLQEMTSPYRHRPVSEY